MVSELAGVIIPSAVTTGYSEQAAHKEQDKLLDSNHVSL